MERSLDEFWFTLEMAWSTARTEVRAHAALTVAFVAIVLLIWIFLSPGINRR
jgi:hypothetical protein